jgi:ribosomal protein S5
VSPTSDQKSFGDLNPHNVIHAVVMALKALRSAEHVARVRGRTLAEMRGTPAVPPAAR